jgi:hypothetical protein
LAISQCKKKLKNGKNEKLVFVFIIVFMLGKAPIKIELGLGSTSHGGA